MKRRLILAATAMAIIGGGAGIASAAAPHVSASNNAKAHQLCLVIFYQDGSKGYECVNW